MNDYYDLTVKHKLFFESLAQERNLKKGQMWKLLMSIFFRFLDNNEIPFKITQTQIAKDLNVRPSNICADFNTLIDMGILLRSGIYLDQYEINYRYVPNKIISIKNRKKENIPLSMF
jgi:predicted transcriptional regulator